MATISRRIASISLMLTHPLSGEKCRREITLAQGRSSSIIVDAHAKSQTYYRKACLEHARQTGFSFYPCCPSFPLVNQRTDCYNIDKRNASGGTFPNWFQLNMKNNRSTSQGRAVISFGLLQVNTRLPRQAIQSRQIRSYSRTPNRLFILSVLP